MRIGDCGSHPSWCSACNNHCEGLALGGAFWDLRESIGASAAERIFADFLFVTDGSVDDHLDASVVAEVLAADEDDDGDITNGTVHSAAICEAFGLHGWTCPAPGVDDETIVVNWIGPAGTPNKTEGDYAVHFEFDPPHVTLNTTTKNGVDVVSWQVGRVQLTADPASCPNPPCHLDLGRVGADWVVTGGPRNISVQIGDPDDASKKCRNVNIIDIPSQDADNPSGPTTWSNIRLELSNGSLLGRAQCFANSGNAGGRISGTVIGGAKRVLAHAIGLGASESGTLTISGNIMEMVLGTLPSGSTITASWIEEDVTISGSLEGILQVGTLQRSSGGIRIGGDLLGTVTLTAPGGYPGPIRANGSIVGDITVMNGDMGGDIIANADGDGGGSILGQVTVSGTFNGNICGDNISPSDPLPANIHINPFGPCARICGIYVFDVVIYPGPDGFKNRGLSISIPTATAAPTAIQVTLISLHHPLPANAPCCPPPDFSAFEYGYCTAVGEENYCRRWVGKPATFLEDQGSPGGASFRAARLQCTPFLHDWSTEGIFHIVGAEIIPSSVYQIQAGPSCVAPITVSTARWGDVSADFNPPSTTTQPDVTDVLQLVNKFKSLPGALSKATTQLQPNLPELNADINALDIVAVVAAVKQLAYSFSGPCPCPSAVTCGSLACTKSTPCVTAFGAGSMCVKTCVGGDNDGQPCIIDSHCPGSTCGVKRCSENESECTSNDPCPSPQKCQAGGFCRDSCGRCTP